MLRLVAIWVCLREAVFERRANVTLPPTIPAWSGPELPGRSGHKIPHESGISSKLCLLLQTSLALLRKLLRYNFDSPALAHCARPGEHELA
jgi:hypothetical protein